MKIKSVRERQGTSTTKGNKTRSIQFKLTYFSPCETFHLLRSELNDVAPESMWDWAARQRFEFVLIKYRCKGKNPIDILN